MKLKPDQIADILARGATTPTRQLARQHGVSDPTVHAVLRRHDVVQTRTIKPTAEWRDIPGMPMYEVSDKGEVWSKWTSVLLRCTAGSNKYLRATLTVPTLSGNVERYFTIHRLVLLAFRGPCPKGFQGAHLNGDRGDPRLSNLAWVHPKENAAHRLLHGTQVQGESSPNTQTTDAQAIEVRRLATEEGWRGATIARHLRISIKAVNNLLRGLTWKHLPMADVAPYRGEVHVLAKLNDAAVCAMRRRYAGGESTKDLAREYGVHVETARSAIQRRTWAHVVDGACSS